MAYQALARKWRPKKFADLVGQEHVVGALQNALQQGRLHHAYLLTGTRGVGKTTIARILAKSLNCEQGVGGEPCGECSACTQIDAGRFVDLLEIDAASNTGIDNIREVLENAQYAPTSGRYKVYIIDEVHMLSKSAFNAMLKTLEEPPEHVKFILATTDPHKVPITVLSRCLQFVLRNMTTQQVTQHLAHVLTAEEIIFEEAALTILGRAAMGSMRDALSLLDQAIALGSGKVSEADVRYMLGAVDKRYLFNILTSVIAEDGKALMAQAAELSTQSVGFDNTLSELASLLQQLALIQAVPSSLAEDDPEKEILLFLAKGLSGEQIQLYYQCVLQGKKDLPFSPDEYAGFVMTLLRMLAFAPLAIKPEQMNQKIVNSELQNPLRENLALSDSDTKTDQQSEIKLDKSIDTLSIDPVSTSRMSEKAEDSREILPWEATVSSEEFIVEEPYFEEQNFEQLEPIESQVNSNEIATPKNHTETVNQLIIDEQLIAPKENTEHIAAKGIGETKEKNVVVSEVNIASEGLPELNLNNWSEIVDKLQTQFGAAQMIVKNAVLTKIEGNIITLALSSQAVHNDELLAKVGKVLSDAYQNQWSIRTQVLEDGQETPNMLNQKDKEQRHAQAISLLQEDETAQELINLFDGQWLPDTIELTS